MKNLLRFLFKEKKKYNSQYDEILAKLSSARKENKICYIGQHRCEFKNNRWEVILFNSPTQYFVDDESLANHMTWEYLPF